MPPVAFRHLGGEVAIRRWIQAHSSTPLITINSNSLVDLCKEQMIIQTGSYILVSIGGAGMESILAEYWVRDRTGWDE
ncbi:hypothetical protein M422DRAFT_276483 [Sphaerobolus stellatus SS14]|uniref:Uncharacterized protein n=1 Tax=Sphaerobolus stellatus (strain SS14) TaxID=990650 RepID=A0A0C9TMG5_SPHS4|nr:hypothetical protein M422DRAFT_276483 [Sphaerobolus stellatus SS14]